jgi:hypothetical protein
MPEQAARSNGPKPATMTREERRSLTHGGFRIGEEERAVYGRALRTLNRSGIPYVVSGLYALYAYTGVYRKTKDLDLLFDPHVLLDAARVLSEDGFRVELEQPHWLAKAKMNGLWVDLIYGMGNGLALVDEDWYRFSRAGLLAEEQVRIAPPEELLWHRLYVSERHRQDMADVLHLILCQGDVLDWERLLRRLGDDFRLLTAHVHLFDFAYPGYRRRVPEEVREQLARRLECEDRLRLASAAGQDEKVCAGTLISRFSFNIDVSEWGFHDPRAGVIDRTCEEAIVKEIVQSGIWNG